jgi:thioredoxin 1
MVEKTTDATFEQDVLKATEPVVVDFWAEWCGPCRMIAPALEEISKSLNGKVKIVKLNVDENPGVAAKYGIMSIPTLMMFKNGELASRQVGAAPKQKLEPFEARRVAASLEGRRPERLGRYPSRLALLAPHDDGSQATTSIPAQCRKCRVPVTTIAMPWSSAALITSSSRIEPPG